MVDTLNRSIIQPASLATLTLTLGLTMSLMACGGATPEVSSEDTSPPHSDATNGESEADTEPTRSTGADTESAADSAASVVEDSGPRPEADAPSAPGEVTPEPSEPALSCQEDTGVIVPTPDTFSSYKSWGFDRYAELVAPNGQPVRIFAADKVSDEMVHRARNVLRFFLTDVPGSQYGQDKAEVFNSMADHGATLMLPNGAHEEGNEPPFDAQPLYEAEMTVEGGDWYQNNDWEHRDATFEELFHLVHDAGIGTYMAGALPDYKAALHAEALAAIADGRWGIPVDPFVSEWLDELAEEDSLAQEYIASVIDSYYGYWGAFDEAPGGMWGIYIAKTRDEITEKDPAGRALLEAFLPSMAHYEARLAKSFSGTFEMTFDPSSPYTHKSRYLTAVTLTGDTSASIHGNDDDNTLRGNQGDNTLDGAGGQDTVIYCQDRADYSVSSEGDALIVQGPSGRDTLRSIEVLHFADALYPAALLTP
jgi:hypothetical protein